MLLFLPAVDDDGSLLGLAVHLCGTSMDDLHLRGLQGWNIVERDPCFGGICA